MEDGIEKAMLKIRKQHNVVKDSNQHYGSVTGGFERQSSGQHRLQHVFFDEILDAQIIIPPILTARWDVDEVEVGDVVGSGSNVAGDLEDEHKYWVEVVGQENHDKERSIEKTDEKWRAEYALAAQDWRQAKEVIFSHDRHFKEQQEVDDDVVEGWEGECWASIEMANESGNVVDEWEREAFESFFWLRIQIQQ